MKVVVFGLGSIGQRHARLLSKHWGAELYALRTRKGQSPVRGLKIREVESMAGVAKLNPAAVFVTNPTHLHGETASQCIRAGVRRIFLEKPIDCDPFRLRKLTKLVQKTGTPVYVGYSLRFHPVIAHLKEQLAGRTVRHLRMVCTSWLPDWRAGQNYRKSYSADPEKGGGVLLDLSHEFDLLEFLTGRRLVRLSGWAGNSGKLGIRAEDEADVLATLDGGIRANVHLDFCSYRRERRIQVDVDDGFLEADLLRGRLLSISHDRRPVEKSVPVDADGMYASQLKNFFASSGRELLRDFDVKSRMAGILLGFREMVLS